MHNPLAVLRSKWQERHAVHRLVFFAPAHLENLDVGRMRAGRLLSERLGQPRKHCCALGRRQRARGESTLPQLLSFSKGAGGRLSEKSSSLKCHPASSFCSFVSLALLVSGLFRTIGLPCPSEAAST